MDERKKEVRPAGSFAPPLSDELIESYQAQADGLAESPERDALQTLLRCVRKWWELPESKGEGEPHPSGRGQIVPLDDEYKVALFESIPWRHELKGMAALFEGIDAVEQTALRNMAFHLLWHVVELDLDREPITVDKLTG